MLRILNSVLYGDIFEISSPLKDFKIVGGKFSIGYRLISEIGVIHHISDLNRKSAGFHTSTVV